MLSLGLIINTHEQPDYLARALSAVARQISPPEEVLLADDGDFLVHLADDQTDGQIHLLAHGEGDRLALQGLETGGDDLDGVVAGLQ